MNATTRGFCRWKLTTVRTYASKPTHPRLYRVRSRTDAYCTNILSCSFMGSVPSGIERASDSPFGTWFEILYLSHVKVPADQSPTSYRQNCSEASILNTSSSIDYLTANEIVLNSRLKLIIWTGRRTFLIIGLKSGYISWGLNFTDFGSPKNLTQLAESELNRGRSGSRLDLAPDVQPIMRPYCRLDCQFTWFWSFGVSFHGWHQLKTYSKNILVLSLCPLKLGLHNRERKTYFGWLWKQTHVTSFKFVRNHNSHFRREDFKRLGFYLEENRNAHATTTRPSSGPRGHVGGTRGCAYTVSWDTLLYYAQERVLNNVNFLASSKNVSNFSGSLCEEASI